MNDMDKRSALAVILSFLVLALWWSTISKRQNVPSAPATREVSREQVEEKSSGQIEPVTVQSREIPARTGEAISEEALLEISNPNVRVLIGKTSGDIRHLFIREKNGEVDLIKEGAEKPFRFYAGGQQLQKPMVSKKAGVIRLSYEGAEALYSLRDDYLRLSLSADENVEAAWAGGIGTDPELMEEQEKRKLETFHYSSGGQIKRIKSPLESALSEWASVSNRYFLLAFFPSREMSFSVDPKHARPEIAFSPGSRQLELRILATEKSYSGLSARDIGLEKTLSLGFFSFISVFFIHILNFFYGIFGNYGWSICLLTLVIQIFMFPLTKKNIKSAEAMKRIQPYVKKLQAQHKDDPKRMKEELLNLYRVQKVNPLGGCLPVIIQIPIFWSLFTMLQGLVELRGAPFIFWLNDLSRPDMLFGHLPDFLPFIGSWPIGPLPLLMGATMFFQQKISMTDPSQKMLLLMPIFFTFIFLRFPSGLVLYWLTSNIITLAQHIALKKFK